STYKANDTGKFKLTVAVVASDDKVAVKQPPDKTVDKKGPPANAIALKLEPGKDLQVNGQLTKADTTDAQGKFYKLYTVTLEANQAYRIYLKGNKDFDAF